MNIAIIGGGIAGLTCAWRLAGHHQVTLFEAHSTAGGHIATVDIDTPQGMYAIDTGFIVYNDRTYPRFMGLLSELGISGPKTQMSFSVHNPQSGLVEGQDAQPTVKAFHVSPFNPMDMVYHWRFNSPNKTLHMHIENHQASRVFDSTLKLRREPLTRGAEAWMDGEWETSQLTPLLELIALNSQILGQQEKGFRLFGKPVERLRHWMRRNSRAQARDNIAAHYDLGNSFYARTLAHWRQRFVHAWQEIEKLGFDERFRRMWLYYFGYCEAGFNARTISVVQLTAERV